MENQIKIYYLIISILNATPSTRIVISSEMTIRATAFYGLVLLLLKIF